MSEAEPLSTLGKYLDGMRATGARSELAVSKPRPIVLIEWTGSWLDRAFDTPLMFLSFALGERHSGRKSCSVVRCVEMSRLPLILQQGCDVQPKDAVLWIDKSPSKALEYGGEEKVMMVFDINRTKASYEEVVADTDPKVLEELRSVYPTVVPSIDGSRLWLSRLPQDDRRVASAYEIEHGRWIPGDPIEALAGLVVLGRHLQGLKESVQASVAACPHPRWE
jgi:hypothetical protein